MKKLLAFLGMVFIASLSHAVELEWNAGFEASPGNSDAFAEGPERIRDDKQNVRARMEVEHEFGKVNTDDNGLHNIGSARCFIQNLAPTQIEREDFNPGAAGAQNLNVLPTNDTSTFFLGHGRCWIDEDGPDETVGTDDDFTLYTYSEDPNQDASTADAGWQQVGSGVDIFTDTNKLACGGFDCMVTGISEINSGDVVPVMGRWTDSVTGTISYQNTQASDGDGIALRIATSTDGDSLQYELDGLKTSLTYYVFARVREVAGTDGSCGVKTNNMTTGGGANMAEKTTTGTGNFETITGTFTTGTSLHATPQLDLEVNRTSGTATCEWDHVAVYEQYTGANRLPDAKHLVVYETYATQHVVDDSGGGAPAAWSDGDNPFITGKIKIPDDGYIVKVTADVCLGAGDNGGVVNSAMGVRLLEDAVEVKRAFTAIRETSSGTADWVQVLHMNYVNTNPIPSTEYTFTVEATADSSANTSTELYVNPGLGSAADPGSTIFADSDNGCEGGTGSTLLIEAFRAN